MEISKRSGENLNVLVVDDEADIRETLVLFLESMEVFNSIVEAGNGAEAILKTDNQNFDLIITDLMMPKVRGIELIQRFKEKEKRKGGDIVTPFIVLSANLTGDEVKKAMHFGVKYALTKPCTAEQFVNKVKEVLARDVRHKVKVLA